MVGILTKLMYKLICTNIAQVLTPSEIRAKLSGIANDVSVKVARLKWEMTPIEKRKPEENPFLKDEKKPEGPGKV
jgi:hypothetical protein